MKNLIVIACLALTGCGTVAVNDLGTSKEINLTGFTAAPATNEVRAIMEMSAMKNCPNGYQILSQRLTQSPKTLTWNVKCL